MNPTELLNRFVAQKGDFLYPQMAKPWNEGKWTYASNSYIAVRVVRQFGFGGLKPLKGRAITPSGTKLFERCPPLGPSRRVPKIRKLGWSIVKIGYQNFASKYIRMIADLPKVRLYNGVKPMGAATFKFTGGEGRLMPCIPPSK